jgi:two-component sensor histidine kinase
MAVQTADDYHAEFRVVLTDGSIRWLMSLGRVVATAHGASTFTGVNLDVTKRKEAELSLIESLHEKEVLLKEIHHRVKNNLQVVASLLSLQAEAAGDPRLHAILDECRGRVASMALVHEKLYGTQDIRRIDFGQLARELTTAVASSRAPLGAKVQLEFVCESVRLDIQRAVPTALILNELVTNALKHAFVGRERGRLTIGVQRRDGMLELRVADDGIGLPAGSTGQNAHNTLGMTIIRNLVRQLDAKMSTVVEHGADFRILIPTQEA